ncbi:Putative ribosomal large subunit pseudouridine synthase [Coccomyxa sp. Obi]|nr:Putative ribosomal large subunit pseudouridine synthase [Coccomyxa sp. Obi]
MKSQPGQGRRGAKRLDTTERLSKVIARAGIASRRKAEDLITEGLVKVNGEKILVPQHQVIADKDKIVVNGKELPRTTELWYFAANKPKGYLCANVPGKDGTTRLVIDLFEDWRKTVWKRKHPDPRAVPPRLFTVGRLDVASTGLIFVTNDGMWAQSVQHPSAGITKEYIVTCSAEPTRRQLETIAAGCEVDGAFVTPVAVAPVKDVGQKDRLRIVVAEGRNREVRTLVAHAGLDVVALKRVRIGGYRLPRELGLGQIVSLKPHEVRRISDKGAQANNPTINPYFTGV